MIMILFQILLFVFLAIDINVLFIGRISQPFLREIPKYMKIQVVHCFANFDHQFLEILSMYFHAFTFLQQLTKGRVIVLKEDP